MPEPKFDRPNIENMSADEREKITETLRNAEHLVVVMKNYLATVDFCSEKGIPTTGRESLASLRTPGALGDPVGPLCQLAILFEDGMSKMVRRINIAHKPELEARYQK